MGYLKRCRGRTAEPKAEKVQTKGTRSPIPLSLSSPPFRAVDGAARPAGIRGYSSSLYIACARSSCTEAADVTTACRRRRPPAAAPRIPPAAALLLLLLLLLAAADILAATLLPPPDAPRAPPRTPCAAAATVPMFMAAAVILAFCVPLCVRDVVCRSMRPYRRTPAMPRRQVYLAHRTFFHLCLG